MLNLILTKKFIQYLKVPDIYIINSILKIKSLLKKKIKKNFT
jgi:hypothetical protein